ncbi:MAG: hypothetical protein ACHQ49_13335 [Elusimicrobiota bacterium]
MSRWVFLTAVLAAAPVSAGQVELVPDLGLPKTPVSAAAAPSVAPLPFALISPAGAAFSAAAAPALAPPLAVLPAAAAAPALAPAPLGLRSAPPAAPARAAGDAAAAEAPSAESQAFGETIRFDGARAAPAAPSVPASRVSPETLVDAYQDGLLDAYAYAPRRKLLELAADRAVREKLGSARFKTFYLYGAILGTKMYEAPELPGVLLKVYAAPFGWRGKAWRGYNLAKARLGGLFAETTIVENVEVEINGKKRVLPWALVQEKIKVEHIEGFGNRSYKVLAGMLKRGVRDNDQRQRGIEQLEITRNLGETADGRFVHFDADFFAAEKSAEEGPKRVRDPPVLREAIREAQLDVLRGDPR